MDMWDIHNTLTDLGDKPLANRVIVQGYKDSESD